jgi:branched-chain amino acid aminotransferase
MKESSFQRMANVNGEVTPVDEARIPVLDRGFLYGDSIYEVFRTYEGVPLFCREHFDRLENSARLVHMTISQSREELLEEMRRTARAADVSAGDDIYVRWHVTRGSGPLDLVPPPNLRTSYVIIVKEVPRWNAEFYSRGVRLAVTRVRRNPVESLSPDIKSGNYLNNILGVAEAVELGGDDCLMLNPAGVVTEASNSNVFFVIDDRLVTPSAESGVLRGITKSAIQRVSAEHGFNVHEDRVAAGDVARATECFVTSATREVMPVAGIRLEDGTWREFPTGGGAVTRGVATAYKEAIGRNVREHAELRLC